MSWFKFSWFHVSWGKRSVLGISALAAIVATFAVIACGPKLSRISTIEGIRILGVRKSAPYARPGESVHLQMLLEDGREVPPAELRTFFGFWCVNPAGDSFAQCLTSAPSVEPVFEFDVTEFDVEIPKDALRENESVPGARPSGTAFVFYGVCAGELEVPSIDLDDPDLETFAPKCLNSEGEQVGAEDFVVGYSQIFVFEELRNKNPIITGIMQGEMELRADCIDGECSSSFEVPELDDCEEGVLCFEACEDDADPFSCPSKSVAVVVDPASVEVDSVAEDFGSEQDESIWVHYFIDRGTVNPELKLINDAVEGLQSDYSTLIYSPLEAGPVRVWAVVRDSRGGTAWVRVPGYVKARD
jgi:hypothetical protein